MRGLKDSDHHIGPLAYVHRSQKPCRKVAHNKEAGLVIKRVAVNLITFTLSEIVISQRDNYSIAVHKLPTLFPVRFQGTSRVARDMSLILSGTSR